MKERSPLVSVIIPTYNRANLIGETLASIKNQTYTNWECIIVDDGSSDATEQVVESFINKDTRFSFYKRPLDKPKGANACRNYGFEISKGEFINWFDSDDTMEPNKLELQLDTFNKQLQIPYCICQTQWIDKKSNTFLGLRSKAIVSENRFEDYLLYQIFWSILAPLWRRTFLIDNNLKFDETLHQSQEYDFHLRALEITTNYTAIDVPLVTMYRHNDNISHNIYSNNQKIESNIKVKTKIVSHYFKRLTSAGKLKFLEILTLMFKDLLLNKKLGYAKQIQGLIKRILDIMNLPKQTRNMFLLKLNVAFYAYRIFGRGYNLVRPLSI